MNIGQKSFFIIVTIIESYFLILSMEIASFHKSHISMPNLCLQN